MTPYLIFGIGFAFTAAVQPGPMQAFYLSQATVLGWKRTLPASFAPLISDIPISILMLLFLSRMPDPVLRLLRLAGGVLLLYLAYQSYKSWRIFQAAKQVPKGIKDRTLLKAVLVNLANPAPYLGWSLVLGPMFIRGWQETPLNGIVLILSFYSVMIITSMGIILLFSLAKNLGSGFNRFLIGFSSLALAGLGIYQLVLFVKMMV